jgi:phospholipase/carboxylesterase
MIDKIYFLEMNNWALQIRQPEGNGKEVFLLLHGWTGDEKSMWIFEKRLPKNAWLVAPRAPYPSPAGGYSWVERKSGELPWLDDFRFPVELLQMLLNDLVDRIEVDLSIINLVGFSQGGALALSFGMFNPARVNKIAGLATFLPLKSTDWLARRPLEGKQIFLGHGSQDDIVSVMLARKAARMLHDGGADIVYCETDVGHKLGSDCFNAFEAFFAES